MLRTWLTQLVDGGQRHCDTSLAKKDPSEQKSTVTHVIFHCDFNIFQRLKSMIVKAMSTLTSANDIRFPMAPSPRMDLNDQNDQSVFTRSNFPDNLNHIQCQNLWEYTHP